MPIIRLKPLDPRRGLKLRSYTYRGVKYAVDAGWYEVDAATAAYLKQVRNDSENPESPPAFDVFATQEEALAFEDAQRRKLRERAEASDPIRVHRVTRPQPPSDVLTTRDLPRADTTDGLEGDEGDLESEDLAAEVSKTSRKVVRYVDPEDQDTGVEVTADDDEADAPAPPPVVAAPPAAVPGAPQGSRAARRAALRNPGKPQQGG